MFCRFFILLVLGSLLTQSAYAESYPCAKVAAPADLPSARLRCGNFDVVRLVGGAWDRAVAVGRLLGAGAPIHGMDQRQGNFGIFLGRFA